jgi:hypothetical protein
LQKFRTTADGIPLSKFVIIKEVSDSHWSAELIGDNNWIRNDAGYLGLEFIDDSERFSGYRVSVEEHRSGGVPGFTFYVYYLAPNGEDEGIAVEIGWNPSVGRFQEFQYGADPEGFRNEVRNPPHIRSAPSPVRHSE